MSAELAARPAGRGVAARAASAVGRSRELTLSGVMVLLCLVVAFQAPHFMSLSNMSQVTTLAAIIAIAAVGEAMVIITKNVDLSVESTIGLVAFVVADVLRQKALPVPAAWLVGVGLGLALGMANGAIITLLRVPSLVATLGTLSIFRGLDFFVASGHEVNLADLPAGYSDAASNAEAATIIGIRSRLVIFGAFAGAGLLAGVAGVLWGIEFGTIYATSASGVALQIIAAVVVGGVTIAGGSGTVVGAALGALFLGLINNALLLLQMPQELLQVIYGAVILVAVSADAIIAQRERRLAAERALR
jgi:rhamnose transport system permease protein